MLCLKISKSRYINYAFVHSVSPQGSAVVHNHQQPRQLQRTHQKGTAYKATVTLDHMFELILHSCQFFSAVDHFTSLTFTGHKSRAGVLLYARDSCYKINALSFSSYVLCFLTMVVHTLLTVTLACRDTSLCVVRIAP